MQDTKKMSKKIVPFKNDLRISFWLFFHESYIFSFIHQKHFFINQKLNFSAKIYDTEKMVGYKIVYFKKIYNLGQQHFIIEIIYFV